MYLYPPTTAVFTPLWPELELRREMAAHRLPGETRDQRRARIDAARDMRREVTR